MSLHDIKIDRGWKVLVYFDFILPAFLFLIAWITASPMLARLFHSYEIFVISPVPDFNAFTGIIGFVFHAGTIIYTITKRNIKDLILCIIITIAIFLFFYFEINYTILKPLQFS
ncbi:MAG: hypothetical protein GX187_01930 [Clostridiaceae bacterium]|nr:hypothetical protein [Clostridiaceae bacterium]